MELKKHALALQKFTNRKLLDTRNLFITNNTLSNKFDLNFRAIKVLLVAVFCTFVAVVFLIPDEPAVQFTEKARVNDSPVKSDEASAAEPANTAKAVWASRGVSTFKESRETNQNSPMLISGAANAKNAFQAGTRLALRIVDKATVSQDPVPVMAEQTVDSVTESGITLPAGSKFYGEASFDKGSDRAKVRFTQISLPSGKIRQVSAMAIGKDGQPGIVGRVFSDGLKNSAGQLLTTFVGGLAAGSMQTDLLGHSAGGISNGLLGAVAATSQEKTRAYGDKLKTEREWIELLPNTEFDAVLSSSVNVQATETGHE